MAENSRLSGNSIGNNSNNNNIYFLSVDPNFLKENWKDSSRRRRRRSPSSSSSESSLKESSSHKKRKKRKRESSTSCHEPKRDVNDVRDTEFVVDKPMDTDNEIQKMEEKRVKYSIATYIDLIRPD